MQDHLLGQRIGIGHRVGGLYHLDHLQLSASATTAVVSVLAAACSPDRWHRRLGHLSTARLKLLSSLGVLGCVFESIVCLYRLSVGRTLGPPFSFQ